MSTKTGQVQAIDAAIAARACDHHLREPGFAEQALRKTLKPRRWERQQQFYCFGAVVLRRGASSFRDLLRDGFCGFCFRAPLFLKDLYPTKEDLGGLLISKRGYAAPLGKAPNASLR